MRSSVLTVLTVLTVFTALTAPTAAAQRRGRLSEAASVSQTVDGTRISIEYFRPRAREREQLFGKVVHWGETWTPGANWATTLETSKDIKVNGRPLAKGKYSVWMVVRREGDWTLVLDPRNRRFHTQRPDSTAEQVRMPITPEPVAFTEVLTWLFPEVRMDGTLLTMQWGTTRATVNIEVPPTYAITTPAAVADAYLGRYKYLWKDQEADSTKSFILTVTHENGSLVGRFTPEDVYWKPFILLIRIADDWFVPGVFMRGKLYEMEREIVFEFTMAAGKATEIVVRDEGDGVIASARRLP